MCYSSLQRKIKNREFKISVYQGTKNGSKINGSQSNDKTSVHKHLLRYQ